MTDHTRREFLKGAAAGGAALAVGRSVAAENTAADIPLTPEQGERLLKYKINKEILKNESTMKVILGHFAKDYPVKTFLYKFTPGFVMDIFAALFISGFRKELQNSKTPPTTQSFPDLIKAYISRYYHASDAEYEQKRRIEYPDGNYPPDVRKRIATMEELLGCSLAEQRTRELLDFDHIMTKFAISPMVFTITTDDLEKTAEDRRPSPSARGR